MKKIQNKNLDSNIHSHKNSITNNILKSENNKSPSYNKIFTTNKHYNISNTIKITNKNKIRKYINIPKANGKKINVFYLQTNKIIDNKKNHNTNINDNDKTNSQKNLRNKKSIQHSDVISNFSLKNNKTETIKPKTKFKIISTNSNKCSLIKMNHKQKEENININKQRMDISTNFLFSKKKKFFFTNNSQKQEQKYTTIDTKLYNSNNNILNLNKKSLKKDNSNKKKKENKNHTSTQLQNIFNTSISNSIIIQNYQKLTTMSHKSYKIYKNERQKTSNNINSSLLKKFNYLSNTSRIILDNKNNNFLFFNHKYLGNSLNTIDLSTNFFRSNIKLIDSNSSKKNLGKYLKKIKILKPNEIIDNDDYRNESNNTLKRFKTEKKFELCELDKNIYQLIIKKKKKLLDNEISISLNNKKSYRELNQNSPKKLLNKKNFIGKKNENSQKFLEIKEYKLSPIKSKDKKNNQHNINFLKKNNSKRTNDDNFIKNKNYIQNSDTKKDKKNLSMQIETKYIYQKNYKHIDNNKKSNLKDKIYNTIENNNLYSMNNNRNRYNTIQIKKYDYINHSLSRNINNSINRKNNSNYNKKNNFKIKKIKIGNIEFDFLENDKYKDKYKEKDNDKERDRDMYNQHFKSKIKNVKNYESIKANIIYKNKEDNNNNKIQKKRIFKQNYKNGEKPKIIEDSKDKQIDKEITYINDFYSEEELEEDYLIRDTSQSTNNITKINSQIKNHFTKILKHRTNSKLKNNKKLSLSLLSLYTEEKILINIINFCDYKTLNKLCLLNKQHYKYIKPLIYQKIKLNIIKINKNNNNINNIIKRSILRYTSLSKLSTAMMSKKYKDLLYELNEKYDIEIKKDLLRTAPDNISFQYGKENYNKLYHILSAYSNYNKNIGYAQGLNFLACHCMYIYTNEIDSFIFLDGLIQKFNLENLFGINNNKLNDKLYEIENIVNKWCPEVNKHLKKIILNYDFFTCKWMITLFSNQMNIKYLFQLWDYLIIFGWKFFKGFVISIIKFNEKLILNSSLETITKIINDIFKTKEFENNFYDIIDYTFYYIKEENEI